MTQKTSLIAFRGSNGLGFLNSPPLEGQYDAFKRDPSSMCKDMSFSPDGSHFAWSNGQQISIISVSDCQTVCQIDLPRTSFIQFSPKGTYLATWEAYSAKGTPQESCNLHIWDTQNGTCLKSFIQKKQTNWCPEWSDDETLCARNVSNEVQFFENGEFGNISKKIFMQKVIGFSLAPGPPKYHVACYVPGIKGQPSFVRLFVYPQFEGSSAVIAQKSFFKADRTEFFWSKNGKNLILQTAVDVDKSGASYYGEQNLYFLSVKGETAKIMLGKDGPIYCVKWNPNSTEFCVVYGYMPAKATIYNLQCEPIFDFGTGPRNEIHYTLSGSRLSLSGFGNLRGNVEVWDLVQKKNISTFTATDSTCISWSPDGENILTATTAPRLRIGNGYRIWHYTGSLLQEKFVDPAEELWDMKWQPLPEESIKDKATQFTPVPGIQSAQPEASKQAYRPPGARGQPSTFKLHDYEPPTSASQNDSTANAPMTKNQKKNLAKKAKKGQDKMENGFVVIDSKAPVPPKVSSPSIVPPPVADPEKEKKIKSLLKKLDQIQKLKSDLEAGKHLEINQLEKIKKESELHEELKKLHL